MIRPTPEQRAEMAEYIDAKQPGLLDDLGIKRETSAEQQARDLLERYGVEDAQSWSAGDLVELANLIADANAYRRQST